jgi:mannose-6-phosphate isomerase class I
MTKKIEKLIQQEKKKVEDLKGKITKLRKTEVKQDEDSDEILRLRDQLDQLVQNYQNIEKSWLTQLKKVYLNPYYHRIVKSQSDHASSGVYMYNKESIYPYSDSLFY